MKRYITIISIALISGLVALLGLGYLFEDEILSEVSERVNAHLDVPIHVQNIDFSLISNFPKASVIFTDLSVPDRLDSTKTLLNAKELALHFDLWGLVNGIYVVDQTSLHLADLNMRVNESGDVNYIFWKEPENSDGTVQFKLEEFSLNEVGYSYEDLSQDLLLRAFITEAQSEVLLENNWVEILADLQAEKVYLTYEDETYLDERNLYYKGPLKVSPEGKDVNIASSEVRVGDFLLLVEGRVNEVETGWMLDLHTDVDSELSIILPELPPTYRERFSSMDMEADLEFHMDIKGLSDKIVYPLVDAVFTLSDGRFALPGGKETLKSIRAKGKYHRDEKGKDRLNIAESYANISAGAISYSGSISDFDRPYANGKLNLEGQLKDFIALQPEPSLTQCKGHVELDAQVKGILPSGEISLNDIQALGMRGSLLLTEVGFVLGKEGYSVAALNGEILMKEDDLLFDPIFMTCNGTDMELSGSISGLLAHLTDQKNVLTVKAQVKSGVVNWDRWAASNNTETIETERSEAQIPKGVNLNLEVDLKAFHYDSFTAKEVKGSIKVKGNSVNLSPLSFKSCQGELLSQLTLTEDADYSWTMTAKGEMRNMDVPQIFKEFNHFGQDFIRADQMIGKGDAQVSFKGHLSPDMSPDLNSIIADVDLTLHDGELIEHPAMVDIIDALRERNLLKPFVRADELEREMHHLKFKQLRNHIEIEKGKITIPEMLIANNAMDINIAGQHSFENEIDYTVSFNMRDVLINKSNPQFLIQDDGLGHVLHIKMYGTVDEPQIELDKDKVRENRKEAITQAKEDVKDFFRDPFGKRSDKTDTKEVKSELVLEVEPVKIEDPTSDNTEKKKHSWWNSPDTGSDKEEAPTIVIEDDDF